MAGRVRLIARGTLLLALGASACGADTGAERTADGITESVAVFLIDSEMFQGGDLGSEHLVAVDVAVPAGVDDAAARIEAALRAAAAPTPEQLDAGLVAPVRPEAVPEVTIEGTVAVLDWNRMGASQELGVWSTSSGSLGLWPIIGMVLENVPEVSEIEHRLDASCEVFTEMMQGAGCLQHTREQWNEYTAP
jgi:hypothetical protein